MTHRLAEIARKYGPVSSTLIASQMISAFSLLMLQGVSPSFADLYTIGIQIGTSAYNGIVMGVIYLLAIGRQDFPYWTLANLAAIGFTCGLSAYVTFGISVITFWADFSENIIHLTILLFSFGGILLSVASIKSVKLACEGSPLPLAATTIIPNLFMITSVGVISQISYPSGYYLAAPAFFWMIGSLLSVLIAIRLEGTSTPVTARAMNEKKSSLILHAFGLLIGLIPQIIIPISLTTAAITALGAGTSSILFLINRLISALIGAFVNGYLMVRIGWSSPYSINKVSISKWLMIPTALSFAASGFFFILRDDHWLTISLVISAWMSTLIISPVLLREANFRRMSLLIVVKSALDASIGLGALWLFLRDPSLITYFSVFLCSQALTLTAISVGLNLRNSAILGAIMLCSAFIPLAVGSQ